VVELVVCSGVVELVVGSGVVVVVVGSGVVVVVVGAGVVATQTLDDQLKENPWSSVTEFATKKILANPVLILPFQKPISLRQLIVFVLAPQYPSSAFPDILCNNLLHEVEAPRHSVTYRWSLSNRVFTDASIQRVWLGACMS
jgi:hypothetical protein